MFPFFSPAAEISFISGDPYILFDSEKSLGLIQGPVARTLVILVILVILVNLKIS